MNGMAGVRLFWIGCSQVKSLLHFGMNVLKRAIRMPSPRPPMNARGQADQVANGRGSDRDHDDVEELRGRERREPRGDQDPGESGEERRQRPRSSRHPIGGDAVELGHARALDDRSHPQTDGGEREQCRECGGRQTGRRHRDELVAAEGVEAEHLVEDAVAVRDDAFGSQARPGLVVHHDVDDRRERQRQADRDHEPGDRLGRSSGDGTPPIRARCRPVVPGRPLTRRTLGRLASPIRCAA